MVDDRGGSGTAGGTTSWTINGIALQSGVNNITVTAWDAANNQGAATIAVTYTPPDTTKPTITITSPTSNPTYSTTSSTINLGGTASDNVGVTQVTWSNDRGGSGTAGGTTSWTINGISLQSGVNNITVTAWDAANNQNTGTIAVTYAPVQPPDQPALFAPTNGATNQATSLNLQWNAAARASTYDVYFGTSSSPLLYQSGVTNTSLTVSAPNNNTTYYWNVVAKNSAGSSLASSTWWFVTAPAPVAASDPPTLFAPANGATNQATSLSLQWNAPARASTYDVYFGTSSSPPLYQSGVINTSLTVSAPNNNTTYYWNVVAKNSAGSSLASSTWWFATAPAPVQPPDPPTLFAPANGATNQATSLSLQWNAPARATTYNVYLGTTSSPTLYQSGVTGTSLAVSLPNNNTTYYWNVVAKNSAGSSLASSTWWFVTSAAGAQLVNGDFSQGLTGWTTSIVQGCGTRTASIVSDAPYSHVLELNSIENGGCGGAATVYQDLDIQASAYTSLILSANVKAVSADVTSGCGKQGQEYPIELQVSYTDSQNSSRLLIFAFYYGGGTCGSPTEVPPTTIYETASVAQNQWFAFVSPNLKNWIADGFRIKRITVVGSGWDYVGRAGSISLDAPVALPDLTIVKSHSSNFTQGQTAATYTITVSNSGSGATSGTVTVTDTLPSGLMAATISGSGWSCNVGTLTCTRNDPLASSGSYPAVAVTVNVAGNAPASVTNTATVSGGGETNTSNDTASDVTTITPLPPDLTITKTHTGNFTQGQTGAAYTITVSNSGSASTSGTVTVVDMLPSGLTATAMTGSGWGCTLSTKTCTRNDVLAAGSSYPAITLTVNVAGNASSSVTNTAKVSGGGETNTSNDTASDVTTITPLPPDLTINKTHTGSFTQGQTGAVYTITVSNSGSAASSGTVTVTDTLPSSLTATGLSGTGWSCAVSTKNCTRADALAAGGTYPPITLTVNVASNAPASVTNTATVSGGGETNTGNNTASDPTTITPLLPDLTITKTHTGTFTQGQTGATYTITVYNIGSGLTSGTVTVVDTLPMGLTASALSGAGWNCTLTSLTCTRSDVLAPSGNRYQDITLTVNVASNAPAVVSNIASVSTPGDTNATNDNAIDTTYITGNSLQFFPVTPCRVADTRGNGKTGAYGPPSIAGGATRDFSIPSGGCGIPTNAQAYALNVTVVPPSQLVYLTMWPTGQPRPTVSTLNDFSTQVATPGNVVANAAIVPAGTNGAVSVYVSDTSDVIIDINGYFAPPATNGLAFYPLTPCRVADTRGYGKSGSFGPPIMAGGSSRSFPISQSSCNVPSTAQVYSLNMTVVPPGQLTYLTAWPSGQSMPVVSTLNDFSIGIPAQAVGKVVANAAIVPAGADGAVSVFVSDSTDVIVDINGYFAPPGGPGALSYYTTPPCRVADTRGNGMSGSFGPPTMAGGSTRTVPVSQSSCGIPTSAQAYSLNMTVVPPNQLIYLTTWPAGQSMPAVSTLNDFSDGTVVPGRVVANAAIVPVGASGSVNVFVSDPTDVIIDINGYFAPTPPPLPW